MSVLENVHIWQKCDNCHCQPIIGKRYECQTCPIGPHSDLCSTCFALYELGKLEHPGRDNFCRVAGAHEFLPINANPNTATSNWLEVPLFKNENPTLKKGFLVRPEFNAKDYSCIGGYGFIVDTSRGAIMLTALHVMDELIKKKNIDTSTANESYTGEEVPKVIINVTLYNVLKTKWMFHAIGSCKSMLQLRDARTGCVEPTSSEDIAAFEVESSSQSEWHQLAITPPEVGETIWLAVKMKHSSNLLPAVVVECNKQNLVFRFDKNHEPQPRYTSGAPLVNQKGEVVGINVGAGSFQNCRFGHANHVGNIRRHLRLE